MAGLSCRLVSSHDGCLRRLAREGVFVNETDCQPPQRPSNERLSAEIPGIPWTPLAGLPGGGEVAISLSSEIQVLYWQRITMTSEFANRSAPVGELAFGRDGQGFGAGQLSGQIGQIARAACWPPLHVAFGGTAKRVLDAKAGVGTSARFR